MAPIDSLNLAAANRSPRVDICLLNYKTYDLTAACLRSIRELDYPNFGVVVVDNGSGDGSGQRLKQAFPEIRLIESEKNLGFSGGMNLAMHAAVAEGAEHVWLLNTDTIVDRNALAALVAKALSHQRIGIVGSLVHEMDQPGVIQSCGGKVNWFLLRPMNINQLAEMPRLEYISCCSALVKKQVLLDVGLLDEQFFFYADDIDWSYRMRRAGWELVTAEDSIVYHLEKASAGRGAWSELELTKAMNVLAAKYSWIWPLSVGFRTAAMCVNRLRRGQADRVLPLIRAIGAAFTAQQQAIYRPLDVSSAASPANAAATIEPSSTAAT
ncbi:MAG TPA: glycosyltransferase family 2 protein [Pirellulales bacterium]|nr:glycosyltransferase family 2 protein [Pirellulales bacterium]